MSDRATIPVEEKWFRNRIAWYRAGVLPEDEVDRFETLRRDSESCRFLWESAEGTDLADLVHIPASFLPKWPDALEDLPPSVRELLLEHMAGCEECQEDLRRLRALRFAPEGRRSRRGPLVWAALGTAAAAIWLVMLARPDFVPEYRYEVLRGTPMNEFLADPGTKRARLFLPTAFELGIHDDQELVVRVLDPNRNVVGLREGRAGELTTPEVIDIEARDGLAAGVYSIVLSDRPDTLFFRMNLNPE